MNLVAQLDNLSAARALDPGAAAGPGGGDPTGLPDGGTDTFAGILESLSLDTQNTQNAENAQNGQDTQNTQNADATLDANPEAATPTTALMDTVQTAAAVHPDGALSAALWALVVAQHLAASPAAGAGAPEAGGAAATASETIAPGLVRQEISGRALPGSVATHVDVASGIVRVSQSRGAAGPVDSGLALETSTAHALRGAPLDGPAPETPSAARGPIGPARTDAAAGEHSSTAFAAESGLVRDLGRRSPLDVAATRGLQPGPAGRDAGPGAVPTADQAASRLAVLRSAELPASATQVGPMPGEPRPGRAPAADASQPRSPGPLATVPTIPGASELPASVPTSELPGTAPIGSGVLPSDVVTAGPLGPGAYQAPSQASSQSSSQSSSQTGSQASQAGSQTLGQSGIPTQVPSEPTSAPVGAVSESQVRAEPTRRTEHVEVGARGHARGSRAATVAAVSAIKSETAPAGVAEAKLPSDGRGQIPTRAHGLDGFGSPAAARSLARGAIQAALANPAPDSGGAQASGGRVAVHASAEPQPSAMPIGEAAEEGTEWQLEAELIRDAAWGKGSVTQDGSQTSQAGPERTTTTFTPAASTLVTTPAMPTTPSGATGAGEVAPLADPAGLDSAARHPELQQQIVRAIRLQWRDGSGEATLRLQPERLGEVRVTLRVEHGRVVALLNADNPETRSWIQAHERVLRTALAEQGLDLDRLMVSDSLEERGRKSQQEQPAYPRPRPRPAPGGSEARFEVHA